MTQLWGVISSDVNYLFHVVFSLLIYVGLQEITIPAGRLSHDDMIRIGPTRDIALYYTEITSCWTELFRSRIHRVHLHAAYWPTALNNKICIQNCVIYFIY